MLGWCYGDHECMYQVTGMGVALPGNQRARSVQTVFRSLNRHSSKLGACCVNKRTPHYFCPTYLLTVDRTQPVSVERITPGLIPDLANWPLLHHVNSSILKLGLDSWNLELGFCQNSGRGLPKNLKGEQNET